MNNSNVQANAITCSVADAMSTLGIGKTLLYQLIANGSLISITLGKKRLIIVKSMHDFVQQQITQQHASR